DSGQQPVQCGLIGEQPGDDRLRAVALDMQAAEPGRPVVVENTFDADFVVGRQSWEAHAQVTRSVMSHPWPPVSSGAVFPNARDDRRGSGPPPGRSTVIWSLKMPPRPSNMEPKKAHPKAGYWAFV